MIHRQHQDLIVFFLFFSQKFLLMIHRQLQDSRVFFLFFSKKFLLMIHRQHQDFLFNFFTKIPSDDT